LKPRDGGKQYIAALQSRERERTGIASLKVGFNKVFAITSKSRTRIVTASARLRAPQTLTGAERYVTPTSRNTKQSPRCEERIAAREAEVLDQLRRRVRA